jgi:hypothetical protein
MVFFSSHFYKSIFQTAVGLFISSFFFGTCHDSLMNYFVSAENDLVSIYCCTRFQ